MNLVPKQLALMNRIAYYNPPDRLLRRIGGTLSVGQLGAALLDEGGEPCAPAGEAAQALREIVRDDALAALKVIAYINHNDTNGFVGYAFRDALGGVLAMFRGSESTAHCAPSNVDWLDNVLAPFDGSIQYADVRRFISHYASGPLLITGHSKGAHNALYALAVSDNDGARCVCFNGQGFAPGQLNRAQRAALYARAVNYVQRNDIVGALLMHPERRVFVAAVGTGNAHTISSMMFDEEGWPVPASRSLRSMATGVVSNAIELRIPNWGNQGASLPFGGESRDITT